MPDSNSNDKTRSHVQLAHGSIIGHYRIIERIGAGGMGEVYLAEDTALNRKVALKFLPPHLCQDPDCRARFKREAQAAAKLNHPNIVTIHEVSEFRGRPFLVMEYLQGQSLRDLMTTKDLTLGRVIDIAAQLCEGLGKAHEEKVIHRDIKPSNIMIDPNGKVKILDFGLATVVGSEPLTKTGTTIGTVGYMSPEQVTGGEVRANSDLFSLGVVVYEMLTGMRPFRGDTEGGVLHAIVNSAPDPMACYNQAIPERVQAIISKALEKDANLRYQRADELLSDLRGKQPVSAVAFQAPRELYLRRGSVLVVVSVIVVGIAAAGYFLIGKPSSDTTPASRTRLTYVGNAMSPSLSPDGKSIAYVAKSQSDVPDAIRVQEIPGSSARTIYEAPEIDALMWSPDGSELLAAVTTELGDRLVLLDRFGSTHRLYPVHGLSIAWSPDGGRFVAAWPTERCLYIVEKKSGQITSVSTNFDDNPVRSVSWSSSGLRFAVNTWHIGKAISTLWTCAVDGSNAERVLDTTALGDASWSHGGDALYIISGRETADLIRIPVNPRTGRRTGDARVILGGLQLSGYTISADGRSFAFCQWEEWSNLWRVRVDERGAVTSGPLALTTGTSNVRLPSISPDGSQVAFVRNTPEEELHIFTASVDGSDAYQITHTGSECWSPAWSPDGSMIAYSCWDESAGSSIAIIGAQGGSPRVLTKSDGNSLLTWAPGPNILYSEWKNPGLHTVNPMTGVVTSLALPRSTRREAPARYSPDGRHYAAICTPRADTSRETQQRVRELSVFAVGSDNPEKTWRLGTDANRCLGWSQDSRWVYYTVEVDSSIEIARVDISNGSVKTVMRLPQSNAKSVTMGPDCRTFVYDLGDSKSDIWLVKDFDPDTK